MAKRAAAQSQQYQTTRPGALVDTNPAAYVLNERVVTRVFSGRNEVVCTFCLLQVLTAAYRLGNAKPTLNGTLMGYYRPATFAACDGTAGTRQQARCKSILDFVRGRGSAVDFAKPETVRLINSQVERATNGKIRQLFTSLAADTSLIFASALVFRDKWGRQLEAQPGVFRTGAGPVNTEMLYKETWLPLLDGSTDGVIGVSLSYRNDAIRMFLFTTTDGSPVQDKLRQRHYQALVGEHNITYTAVTLPSFNIDSKKYSYIDLAQQMGIREMFVRGLGADDRLLVDQLVHKAVISSDRHGTEAAAGAAGIGLVPTSLPPKPFQARFDQPFVCSLVHVELGVPIFTAYIHDPTQK
ncbi:serine protease inhibitor A3N-like [Pollicipes pollicipes]|uniref:serine protease inhibitor A3N-like n=1 Tax=Pollicipes pollicipes TaxID=41117 RepID=UPI00188562FF|nr:serine protease inhibitor A3N-like [Pollicipes pollicipes]